MRYLYLLRHAKSSWDDPGLDDHERPLAPRGVRAARRMAEHVRARGIVPELVVCSSSRRTRQTLEPLEEVWGASRVSIEDELYAAGEAQLLARVRRIAADVASAALIGHEPGTSALCLLLAGGGDERLRRRVEVKFPTGALATLALPSGGWASAGPGSAELVGFVRPRDLKS